MKGQVAGILKRKVYGTDTSQSTRDRSWSFVKRVGGQFIPAGPYHKRVTSEAAPPTARRPGFMRRLRNEVIKPFRRRSQQEERARPGGKRKTRKVKQVRNVSSQIIADPRRRAYQKLKQAYRRGQIRI